MNKVFADMVNTDFIKEFKDSCRESSSTSYGLKQSASMKPEKKNKKTYRASSFDIKYRDFDNRVEDFNSVDLVMYFKTKANESGYKFFVSNMAKEASIMKKLKETYSNLEICGMIEFLYCSDQPYLKKDGLHVGIFSSSWTNTIYADMKLWVDGNYSPTTKKSNKKFDDSREWRKTDTEENSTGGYIGNWDV